jgi:colanic acid biosynthesis glycosyl transferase WcaI
MRVIFLTFHLPHPEEPGATRPWEELQLMRELGWQVIVVTCSANYLTGAIEHRVRFLWRHDVEGDVTIIRTWAPTCFRSSLRRRLLCYTSYLLIAFLAGCLVRRVDAIFAGTDPPFATLSAALLALRHRARLVLDERDVHPDAALAAGYKLPRFLATGLSLWGCWIRRHAAAVITVSPGLKRLLLGRGARSDRIFVIPNYFPPTDMNTFPIHAPTSDRKFIALYAGTMGPSYDLATCLEAAAILQQHGYDAIHFVLIGAGDRHSRYVAECSARGIRNIEFRGGVPRQEVLSALSTANVGIVALGSHPYWRYALSSKVFDYMANGLPVVFAGDGDIAALIRDSEGGVVVPPHDAQGMADALVWLSQNPEVCRAMGRQARHYIEQKFTRESTRSIISVAVSGCGEKPIEEYNKAVDHETQRNG